MSLWDDIKSNFDFEKFQIEDMWSMIKEDPERLFIGAIDPFSSELWSTVTGKDYEPLVNQWGGATNERFIRADEAGIDIEPAQAMHGAAKDIAQSFALSYAGGKAGTYGESKGMSPEAAGGLEQGIKQIGGAALNPPPPDPEDALSLEA